MGSIIRVKTRKQRQPYVLVVDDDYDIRQVLRTKLELASCTVAEASNGQEGLVAAKSRSKPDVILLDIAMPIMDGLTMLEELRKKEVTTLIPVILMTNFALFKKSPESYPYVLKCNWDLNDMVQKVKTLCLS